MKTKVIINGVVFLLFASLALFAQDDTSAVWGRRYSNAQNMEQKYDILSSIVELRDAATVPVLMDAMRDLISTEKNLKTARDRQLNNDATRITAKALGDFKAKEAGQLLFAVVNMAREPYLKGEAIHALGKIGAEEYVDDIATMLENINLNYDTGKPSKDGEVVAYACVLALDMLKQTGAFRPLFFASIGWYSAESRVKERAAEAMIELVYDPSQYLEDLIYDEPEYFVKLQALETEYRSLAKDSAKADVAVGALRQGLLHHPDSVVEAANLHRLRLTALEMLSKYRTSNPETPVLLEELISRNYPVDEKLTAIIALGSQNTDDSVEVLVRYLKTQNDRQASAVVPEDYRIVLTTIQALGDTGNPVAMEELMRVRFSNWTPAVESEAEKALKKLE